MTVNELIRKLSDFDGNLDVEINPVIWRTSVSSVEQETKYSKFDKDFDEQIIVIS